ncbi:MAG: helix-turn-helix domain-containing protein [Treponema sp.]|nr:helix-turn-helix domain-containing protein [Treponema sp.]
MNEQELRGILSSNIKRCRSNKNLSQLVLAEKLNISPNFLSDIERCKAWVSPNTLVRLASVLDVEPFELFKPDALFSDLEKSILQRYAEENLKAVLSVMNSLKVTQAQRE